MSTTCSNSAFIEIIFDKKNNDWDLDLLEACLSNQIINHILKIPISCFGDIGEKMKNLETCF